MSRCFFKSRTASYDDNGATDDDRCGNYSDGAGEPAVWTEKTTQTKTMLGAGPRRHWDRVRAKRRTSSSVWQAKRRHPSSALPRDRLFHPVGHRAATIFSPPGCASHRHHPSATRWPCDTRHLLFLSSTTADPLLRCDRRNGVPPPSA
jgi:hypothetical protein